MPRKKVYNKHYKGRAFKPWIKATAPAIKYVAMKTAKAVVKKAFNTEMKYYDLEHTTANMTNTGTIVPINLVPTSGMEGPGQDREGRQIKCMTVNIHGSILGNDSFNNVCKFELWWGNDIQGVLPTYGTLYDLTESDGTALAATNNIYAFRKMNNSHNYKKLKSVNLVLNKNGGNRYYIDWYIKLGKDGNGIITKWQEDDTTGVIANLRKGVLFVVHVTAGATGTPEVAWMSRVRYIDN